MCRITLPLIWAGWLLAAQIAAAAPDGSVDFNQTIRPILSEHCFACHGPDEAERQFDLRLDRAEGIKSVIDPKEPLKSKLISRISDHDDDRVMPPPGFHKPLSEQQREDLTLWISQGATFSPHWAFEPIVALETPDNDRAIDHFIIQALSRRNLQANPRADGPTLLRRIHLSLTGLPPTPEQIAAFRVDPSANHYAEVVDKLLDSPEFGQHVGRYWLDLVRYADTHGLHFDNYREMWPYRDWVIDAINDDMPFDDFITKQLAGDLIDGSTQSDKVASGLNRLNVTTNESGSIYDEVFSRNNIDRTDAFGTIFLGLTTQCAACHDHKFDPIKQSDYYSLLAFFNSLDGLALDGNAKDHPPSLRLVSEQQRKRIFDLDQQIAQFDTEMRGPNPTVDLAQSRWQRGLVDPTSIQTIDDSLNREQKIQPTDPSLGSTIRLGEDQSITPSRSSDPQTLTFQSTLPGRIDWQTIRLEATAQTPQGSPLSDELSNEYDIVFSEIQFEMQSIDGEWFSVPIESAIADHRATDESFGIEKAIDGNFDLATGWGLTGGSQSDPKTAWFFVPGLFSDAESFEIRVKIRYRHTQHSDRKLRLFVSDSPPQIPEAMRISMTPFQAIGPFELANASSGFENEIVSLGNHAPKLSRRVKYEGRHLRWKEIVGLKPVKIYSLPKVEQRPSVTTLYRQITSPSATNAQLLIDCDGGLIVELNGNEIHRSRGEQDNFQPLSKTIALPLTAGENHLYLRVIDSGQQNRLAYAIRSIAYPLPETMAEIVHSADAEHQQDLRQYFRRVICVHPDWTTLVVLRNTVAKQKQSMLQTLPTTLVWKELPAPRPAKILIGGQYDQPGEIVPRRTPNFLPPMPKDAPLNRLGLAQWLTDPSHPLTARVAVNRYWQMLFGVGLTKTSEDFGSQGEAPSHPELLDHLASEFVAKQWSVKSLIRTIVLSDAFCRDPAITQSMAMVDPLNRYYARGPRYRLDAEVLRDQALHLGRLLARLDGGPSVKPPQPKGLWSAVGYVGSDTGKFIPDQNDNVYRRSVYTFWKRTSSPPQMSTFDAPTREVCTSRRERTNTPMQALVLMNETQFMDAAVGLAARVQAQPELQTQVARAKWMFEIVTAKQPDAIQIEAMQSLLDDLTAYYQANPELAVKLNNDPGAQNASMVILASTLLNLDQVISN